MKDSNRCDLHIHSVFSDSDAGIEDIFREAKDKNLSCISITDHDTLEGLLLARKFSKVYGVELVEGLEMSTQYKGSEIHILGYFIDCNNEEFQKELVQIRCLRRERIFLMAEKLNSLGIKVDNQKLIRKINDAIPTRLHLALYLLDQGRVNSLSEAFRKYLAPGKPAYVARFKFNAQEAIKLIKDSSGMPVLAHPHLIANQIWVEELIKLGIDGLEATYPGMPQAKRSLYRNLANKYNLIETGGSDAHGSYKKFTEIGAVTIEYNQIEKMKECLKIPAT